MRSPCAKPLRSANDSSTVTGLLASATLITCAASAVISLILAASNRRWIPLVIAVLTAVPALASVQLLKRGLLEKTPTGSRSRPRTPCPPGTPPQQRQP